MTLPVVNVGNPVTKDLWDLTKSELDDHETRINNVEGGSSKVEIINELFINQAQLISSSVITGISYFRAASSFTLISAIITVLNAGDAGDAEMDVLKSEAVDGFAGPFTSVFTTKPSVNFSTGDDTASTNASFSTTAVAAGDILRIDLTSFQLPTKRIQLYVIGDI